MSQASTKTQTAIPRSSTSRPNVSARWIYQPLRDSRLAIVVVACFVVAVIALVAVVTGKAYLAVMAGAATAAVVWRSYLPVDYELNYKGLRQTVLRWSRTTPWNVVTSVRLLDDGFLLEARAPLGLLAWHRSLFAPWGDHEIEVRECLMKLVPHLVDDQRVGEEDGQDQENTGTE